MRFMTSGATVQTHRSMLICKGTTLVAVTSKTTRLVDGDASRLTGCHERAVRVMAVDTRHRPLRKAVGMRSVELSGGIRVTIRTLLIHVDRLSRD